MVASSKMSRFKFFIIYKKNGESIFLNFRLDFKYLKNKNQVIFRKLLCKKIGIYFRILTTHVL